MEVWCVEKWLLALIASLPKPPFALASNDCIDARVLSVETTACAEVGVGVATVPELAVCCSTWVLAI